MLPRVAVVEAIEGHEGFGDVSVPAAAASFQPLGRGFALRFGRSAANLPVLVPELRIANFNSAIAPSVAERNFVNLRRRSFEYAPIASSSAMSQMKPSAVWVLFFMNLSATPTIGHAPMLREFQFVARFEVSSGDTRNPTLVAVRKAAAGSKPFEKYLEHEGLSREGRFRCVEISVFDSGLGLAARWLGKKLDATLSLTEEYEACLKCLQKHQSSSKQAHAGIGLYEVVRTLSPLRGFLR
jgi:hypothetical protein